METTINNRTGNGPPGEGWGPYSQRQVFAWWADQMAQAYRLATSASLFPALAALQHARLLSADVAAVGEVAAAQQGCYWEGIRTLFQIQTPKIPREKVPPERRKMPGTHESELEELKKAMFDYEECRGDWSKAR
jgi:DNA-binding transcriptional regulator YbjK